VTGHLPDQYDAEELAELKALAAEIVAALKVLPTDPPSDEQS
jgi:hypothetical protein